MFYLFRQYGNQKELHRSHLVSTKTGGTQCGVGINNLAYSYLLVHFIEKKIKDKTILNSSKIILYGFMTNFWKKRYLHGIVSSNMKEKKKLTNKRSRINVLYFCTFLQLTEPRFSK